MIEPTHPADLEERFKQPEGWRWHYLNVNGRKIRFGSVSPRNSIPDAVIVCLPGLSEFCEKYFETAREMLNRNYAFRVLDWMGQGLSERYLPNTHKRHSEGFSQDVEDLSQFIKDYIKPASVHPDRGRIPMAMLAHSMGANIGLHYLHKYPEIFECAALSAPMLRIKALCKVPKFAHAPITKAVSAIAGKKYVMGGQDWTPTIRGDIDKDIFSSDPHRAKLQNLWFEHISGLQVGNVTYGWVHQAVKSCLSLDPPSVLSTIQTHCVIASAELDMLVDNKAIARAALEMPNAKHIELKNSKHEILMERDDIRTPFLNQFYALIKERIIDRPETLKPF